MGQSPSATVYWGYDLVDLRDYNTWDSLKPPWMEDENTDWEEELATRLGWVRLPYPEGRPKHPYFGVSQAQYDKEMQAWQKAMEKFKQTDKYRVWLDNQAEMRNMVKNYPVILATYGGGEEPRYCVCISESVQRVGDWGSKPLEPIVTDGAWHIELTGFMRLMELPIPDDPPGWHLNCSYG